MDLDEFHGQGGSFEVREGKRVLVAPPTQPHPDGDRARNSDGKPVDAATAPAPATEEAPPEQKSDQDEPTKSRRGISRFFSEPDPEPRSDN